MAVKTYAVNDAETNKAWARELYRETIRQTYFSKFMGTGPQNLIQERTELSKGAGDKVTVTLLRNLTQHGIQSDGQVEGNEEATATFTDSVLIDSLDFSVRVRNQGTIDAQRVPFDLGSEARDLLANHWAERFDISMFNQLAGYTATSGADTELLGNDNRYTGLNSTVAPSTNRVVFGGSGNTTDQAVEADTTAVFTLNMIDKAVNKARQKGAAGEPRIRPLRIGGKSMYVVFIHPDQEYDLRTDATTAGNWFDIQQAAIMGGETTENPIFTGALGVYNNCILHCSESVPYGVHSSTAAAQTSTRRAVLCGAQAAVCAFGQGNSGGKMDWTEELFNYRKELGVDSHCMFGMKKLVYNSQDFGTITLVSYANVA